MNRKITWGLVMIIASVFYGLQTFFPDLLSESVTKYIFNYQVILIAIGLFFIARKKTFGWFVFSIGLYLYLEEFMRDYFKIGFPIIALVGGIVFLVLGINEKKASKEKKENIVYKSTMKAEKVKKEKEEGTEIEDAEIVK